MIVGILFTYQKLIIKICTFIAVSATEGKFDDDLLKLYYIV